MNLLDQFVLQHVQVSTLKAELVKISRKKGSQEARVELNLTPRIMDPPEDSSLPLYQVSARLDCHSPVDDQKGPAFKAVVGIEAVYQQVSGDPVDVSSFTHGHSALARQLYPMLQQEMRGLLIRMGLNHLQLPFDLAPSQSGSGEAPVEISSSVH